MLSNIAPLSFVRRCGIAILLSLVLAFQGFAQHHPLSIKFSNTGFARLKIPSLNGNKIHVQFETPEGDGPFPALIGVSGGDGAYAFHQDESEQLLAALNESNILCVDFAPQGRAGSEGEDHYHGFVHQDDLKAIVDFLIKQPFVDLNRIGMISFSYGVALATGALSRHPDMPVQFLVDVEGPAAPGRDMLRGFETNAPWIKKFLSGMGRTDATTKKELLSMIIHGGRIGNDAYWDERDASHFAKTLPCPYLRIQCKADHVQGYSKAHMMAIINAAAGHSGQWTRCNDNPPGMIYTEATLPQLHFYEEGIEIVSNRILPELIREMFFQRPWEE